MNREIIITDLTRFNNPDLVCTAGVDRNSGECIRPMPYLRRGWCREHDVRPGTILKGDFGPWTNRQGPHQEDFGHGRLKVVGTSSSSQFMDALKQRLFDTVESGFGASIATGQKYIPFGQSGERSIITISASPATLRIVTGSFDQGKIKLHFHDQSGRNYRYIAITDLGFHEYALEHHERNDLNSLNMFISKQEEVLFRLWLNR